MSTIWSAVSPRFGDDWDRIFGSGARYQCPVCFFPEMEVPPRDWHICSCCGTEFEYDDCGISHEELRAAWIIDGAKWWSEHNPPPVGWNAQEQLARGSQ